MHERRFHGETDRLRSPERIKLLEVDRVVSLTIENLNPKSLLDVGTGTALFAEAFAKAGLNITGIDVSEEMIEKAKQHVPNGKFEKAVAEELPFPGKSFDVLFLGLVFHETDEPLKALQEARRTAKLRVSILEWAYKEEEQGPPLEHRLKPETIIEFVNKAGFKSFEKIDLNSLVLYRLEP